MLLLQQQLLLLSNSVNEGGAAVKEELWGEGEEQVNECGECKRAHMVRLCASARIRVCCARKGLAPSPLLQSVKLM